MTQATMQKPLFKHDCNDCIYLGSDVIRDFYFCKERSATKNGSIIVRLGNNPSDYCSMPVDVVKSLYESGEMEEDNLFVLSYLRYMDFLNN